jgi:hypothetical protein
MSTPREPAAETPKRARISTAIATLGLIAAAAMYLATLEQIAKVENLERKRYAVEKDLTSREADNKKLSDQLDMARLERDTLLAVRATKQRDFADLKKVFLQMNSLVTNELKQTSQARRLVDQVRVMISEYPKEPDSVKRMKLR